MPFGRISASTMGRQEMLCSTSSPAASVIDVSGVAVTLGVAFAHEGAEVVQQIAVGNHADQLLLSTTGE
jgi:hypothetical protein